MSQHSVTPIHFPIALIIDAALIILSLVFSVLFTVIQSHHRKKSHLINVLAILITFISLSCIFLIPLDVANVSFGWDFSSSSDGNYPQIHGLPFQILYSVVFAVIVLLAFICMPFAYFFYEAGDNDVPLKTRILSGVKYTLFTLIALILLLGIAIVFSLFNTTVGESFIDFHSLTFEKYMINLVSFVLSCMATVGLVPFLFFTACGFGALPFTLASRMKKKVKMELSDLSEEQDIVDERLQILRHKRNLGTSLSSREEREFKSLTEKQSLLQKKEADMSASSEAGACGKALRIVWLIARNLLAIVLLVAHAFIFLSFIASCAFRVIPKGHSDCSLFCGFSKVHFRSDLELLASPLDFILVESSYLFPIDHILLIVILVLFIWSTITALQRFWVGTWKLLCVKCYRMRTRRTPPQGQLLRAIAIMFAMIGFFFVVFSFAPQYLSFGSQKYYDFDSGKWKLCNFEQISRNVSMPDQVILTSEVLPQLETKHALEDNPTFMLNSVETTENHTEPIKYRPCYLSEMGSLVENMSTRNWGVFGILFYFVNIGFVVFALLGALRGIWALRPKTESTLEDDTETDSSIESDYEGIQ